MATAPPRPNGAAGRNARLLFASLDVATDIWAKLERVRSESNISDAETESFVQKACTGALFAVPCTDMISSVRVARANAAVLLFTDTPLHMIDTAVCMARMHRFDALFTRLCIDVVMATDCVDSWCIRHASRTVVDMASVYCPEDTGRFIQALCTVLVHREREIESTGDVNVGCLFNVLFDRERVAAFNCGYNLSPPERVYPPIDPPLTPVGNDVFDGCSVCGTVEPVCVTCEHCHMRIYCSMTCRATDALLHGDACRGIVDFLVVRAGSRPRFAPRPTKAKWGRAVQQVAATCDCSGAAGAPECDRSSSSCVPASDDLPENAPPVKQAAWQRQSRARKKNKKAANGKEAGV